MTRKLLNSNSLPEWFAYPEEFQYMIQSGLLDIGCWQLLQGDWLEVRHQGLKKRFPARDLVPFARRLDSDDVACWESVSFPNVLVIHDFCAPGWEARATYSSFEDWLKIASDEAKDFDA